METNNLCINCFKNTNGYEICPHCGCVQEETPKQLNHLYPHTVLNDRYIIGKVINNGGFGVVYKAYDMNLQVIVAVKELFPTQNSMATRGPGTTKVITLDGEKGEQFQVQKERFLTEARTMSKLSSCDSIVDIYDFFEENNTAYLIMEFLDGISLREYLENHKTMTYEEALEIIEPVSKALSAVHKEKIVHRDVSPDNVFITNDNKIKLLDFGAAKFSDDDVEKSITVVAKPGYTPPEQYRSKAKIKPCTDVYAVGAMFYRMITGQLPEESIDRVEKDELEHPSKLGVKIPGYAEKSIMKAMALNESARFKTIDDFLLAVKGQKKADFPEVELKRRKRLRIISFVLVMAVIVASVFGGLYAKKSMSFVPKSCSLTVWLTSDDKNDEESWNTIINDYFTTFCSEQENKPDVKVKIEYIDADKYSDEYSAALKKNKQPDIFRSDLVKNSENYRADCSQLYDELSDGDLTAQYSGMKTYFSGENVFAFRFDVPVMYTNISTSASSDLAEITAAAKYDASQKSNNTALTVNSSSVLSAAAALGYKSSGDVGIVNNVMTYAENYDASGQYIDPLAAFGGGTTGYYISNISDRAAVEGYIGSSSLHAYSVSSLPSQQKYYYYFPEQFSVSLNSDSNIKKASMFLLYFLITDYDSQCDMKSSSTGLLPINKKAAETYKNETHGLYDIYKNTDDDCCINYSDMYTFNNCGTKLSEYAKTQSKTETVEKILADY